MRRGNPRTEEYNRYFRNYHRRNLAKMREYKRKYSSEWYKKNGYKHNSKWAKLNRHKVRAQYQARKAIREGKIKRKDCEGCSRKKTIAHHNNYNRPTDVIFLCAACHWLIHKIFTEDELAGVTKKQSISALKNAIKREYLYE